MNARKIVVRIVTFNHSASAIQSIIPDNSYRQLQHSFTTEKRLVHSVVRRQRGAAARTGMLITIQRQDDSIICFSSDCNPVDLEEIYYTWEMPTGLHRFCTIYKTATSPSPNGCFSQKKVVTVKEELTVYVWYLQLRASGEVLELQLFSWASLGFASERVTLTASLCY